MQSSLVFFVKLHFENKFCHLGVFEKEVEINLLLLLSPKSKAPCASSELQLLRQEGPVLIPQP